MKPEPTRRLLITCEHAVPTVPDRWADAFRSPAARTALRSHRGWDPGAADVARDIARTLSIPCVMGRTSRLLVELNRSPDHPQFWSEFSARLPPEAKDQIVRRLYEPFRRRARGWISRLSGPGRAPVYHLSVHTFTPELDGKPRHAEIGILYDPARPPEVRWAAAWKTALAAAAPSWRVRRNYPYAGTDDGHTTALRAELPDAAYAGLELEINQALVFAERPEWMKTRKILVNTLRESLDPSGLP